MRPKTDDSERTIPLPAVCMTALCEHKIRQEAERVDAWSNLQDHGLVFPSRLGTPMEPDDLRRSRGRVRKTAGLDTIRLHDMRHTCVSLLLHLGVAPDVVREIVGHSDIAVTIYAHTSPTTSATRSGSWVMSWADLLCKPIQNAPRSPRGVP